MISKEYRKFEKEDKQIYPDIILHQRNSEKNLMIIEMKKLTPQMKEEKMKIEID